MEFVNWHDVQVHFACLGCPIASLPENESAPPTVENAAAQGDSTPASQPTLTLDLSKGGGKIVRAFCLFL